MSIRAPSVHCSYSPPIHCWTCTPVSTTSARPSRFTAARTNADEIDRAIREHLSTINAGRTSDLVDQIGDGVSQGLAATDVVDISRAAMAGAVSTLVYNFTVDILGTIDDSSGAITFTDDGYDLLSRIAMTVLDRGGEVIAVRPEEVTSSLWNQTAIARLRYALF